MARNNTTNAWDAEVGAYDVAMSYDQNGNLLAMQRYEQVNDTSTRILIDDLTYSYSGGNQLNTIADNTLAGNRDEGFRPVVTARSFTYNSNGNITHDRDQGVSMTYNRLNLPTSVQKSASVKLDYTYAEQGIPFQEILQTVLTPSKLLI